MAGRSSSHARCAAQDRSPHVCGQMEFTPEGMLAMMRAEAIDFSNYDASWGGGPTAWRRVAAVAALHDVRMRHHEEAQLASHLLASVPHRTYAEAFHPDRNPIYWQITANRPDLVDRNFAHSRPTRVRMGVGRIVHR